MAASRSDQPGGSNGGGWGGANLGLRASPYRSGSGFRLRPRRGLCPRRCTDCRGRGILRTTDASRTSRLQRSAVHIGRQCPTGNGPSPARCSRGAGQRGHGLEPPRGPAPPGCVRTGMNERGPWPPGAGGSAPEGTRGTAVSRSSAGSARMADSEQSRHQRATSCSPARHPGPARPPP
jgi:hypothetical protein